MAAKLGRSRGGVGTEVRFVNLIYSEQAVEDLVCLRTFIAEHDPKAAARIARALVDRIEYLRRFPEMGRRVKLAPDPDAIRDVVFGKFIIRYLSHRGIIAILRIWHQLERRGDT